MKNILYILFFFSCLVSGQTVRYASAAGAGAHNGTSEANAWSVSEMRTSATGHMTVHCKAGNYGTGDLIFSNSGSSASNRLTFKGYVTTPGDLDVADDAGPGFSIGSFSTANAPTIQGTRSGGNVPGQRPCCGETPGGIRITGNNVTFENWQIRNWETGFYTFGSNNIIKNCYVRETGDHSGYSGFAIAAFGASTKLLSNLVLNPGAQGITTNGGDNMIIQYNEVYCNQTSTSEYSTDYYIIASEGSNNNNISYNFVHRSPGQFHQGHGVILKGNTTGNTLIDNVIENTCYEFSFEGVTDNDIIGGEIRQTQDNIGGNQFYTFILIGNGAHDNRFDGVTVIGCDAYVLFMDWPDGYTPTPDTDAVSAGYENTFTNFKSINNEEFINFSWQWYGAGQAVDNVFDSGLVYGTEDAIFRTERLNSGTIIRNTVFSDNTASLYNDNTQFQTRVSNNTGTLNLTIVNCLQDDNTATFPGTYLTGDPDFTNEGTEDFTLQATSDLIDAGSTATVATTDFDGNARDSSPDIGPYEFGGGGTINVTSVKTYPTAVETAASTYQLYVDVFPLNADDLTGTWSSDNESVATVNSSGLVTRVSDGQADIEFQSTDGSFTDSSSVTFNSGYSQDAFEVIGPKLYLTPASLDPAVTTDGNPISVWEDMSGSGLNATPQGTIDLNVSGSDRMAEVDGTSYFTVPDDASLDLEPGTDEIYLAVREGDVISSDGGYLISKAAASNRQYGISYFGGELQGVYVGGTLSAFSGVPTGTNRLIEILISTTDVDAYVDGILVLDGGTIGTSVNTGQQVNIGGRTNGSYLMTNGSHIDYVVIDDELPTSGELEDIQEQFNINSAPEPGEENLEAKGTYLGTNKGNGKYLGATRIFH